MRKYAAAQVPMYAGYDWLSVALILVSWYTATAGYAVSAHLPPTAGLALLLSAVLCAVVLLSGAVAPTLRTMFRTGRLFYALSGKPCRVDCACLALEMDSWPCVYCSTVQVQHKSFSVLSERPSSFLQSMCLPECTAVLGWNRCLVRVFAGQRVQSSHVNARE